MAVEDWTPQFSRVCPVCGKTFLPAWQHAWRDKTDHNGSRLVCTYSCMRETERRVEEEREQARQSRCRAVPENMSERQRQTWLSKKFAKCPECRYSQEVIGEKETCVFCTHPDREGISDYWRTHHMPGKVGYLGVINKSGDYHFTRTPKWCPIRQEVQAQ